MYCDADFTLDCTGDVVVGDVILFKEGVFGGTYRKPKHLGNRAVIAEVVKDSYGAAKQQHTFTLKILDSWGTEPLKAETTTTRKGRNVYRKGTKRVPWNDENARTKALEEKHARGSSARYQRAVRKGEMIW